MNKEKPASPHQPKRKRWSRDDTELTLLGLPATIWFVVFCYLPMFGLIIAFKSFKLSPGQGFLYSLFHSDWAGFDNFKFFLTSNTFGLLLRNTILYNLVFIIINLVIPVTLAIIINQLYSRFASKCYQTMMFLPYFMSWVVVSYFVYAFLNPDKGLANSIIMGLGGEKVMWYSAPQYWPFILVFMSTWKSMGYNMVVYLASITGIDGSLYEAAILDGATKWQQAKYITLPSIKPMIIIMFILNIGKIFYSDFGLFWQVTQRVPASLYNTVSTFDTFIFQSLQSQISIGQTAAAGLFQAVCCCVTILITNFIVSKVDEDSAII
ncbi:ABC transporter permease [Anaeromassilibacillus sp. An200]|uniref:Sugar ABC transporter permease n=1 Tax=Candidatus Caccousia stercoris TaxID=2840723 RepID=A0A9D1FTQ7_9FIRM|nr:ABC transporter permease subunit [Anaeromassilibacillus sp. An200]OUP13995.1 sugar ABC transporter permease [Anaeromassilibacillus sp. An200]HIS79783.1 sugar ABC transporter permease [Candidatus Caccousia stercoris]